MKTLYAIGHRVVCKNDWHGVPPCQSSNRASECSLDFAARPDLPHGSNHRQRPVEVLGTEYHALALDALELACREVGHEAYLLAHEFLGIIVLGNARDYRACRDAVIYLELQQLVCLGHFGTFEDSADTYVKPLEIVKRRIFLNGIGLAVSGLPVPR